MAGAPPHASNSFELRRVRALPAPGRTVDSGPAGPHKDQGGDRDSTNLCSGDGQTSSWVCGGALARQALPSRCSWCHDVQ